MRVAEYAGQDATGLAELLRRGDVSETEVYDCALEAITLVNPEINAVANGPWERPADYALDGRFAGVPFAVKDFGDHVPGAPVRSGSRLAGEGVPSPEGSLLALRLRQAGLAIAALTTTPEFGFNTTTEALAYGPTRNPWDLRRSAGGSSGGTAALVAAGAVPAGHGGDGAGSIRIPAACTGLVGLKPSRGRTSYAPDYQEALFGMCIDFVVTRTLRDCAAFLDAVAGPAAGDKYLIKEPDGPWTDDVGAAPGRLRVALHTSSWSDVAVDAEVAAVVEAVGCQLAALGHDVQYAAPVVDWDEFIAAEVDVYAACNAEVVEALADVTGARPGPDTLEHAMLTSWERGRELKALEVARAMRTVNTVARAVGGFFARWDLLITPTMNVAALPLGSQDANDPCYDAEEWLRCMLGPCSFAPLFNWTGTPAMSLPLGETSDGLPVGVQLAAPMCQERTLFRVGAQLEAAMPWAGRRPAIHAARLSRGHVSASLLGQG